MSLRLALALVPLALVTGQTVQVDGSGTTNPSKFFWKVMETMEVRAKKDLRLTYRAVGSSTGQKEFSQVSDGDYSGSLSDFGAGDIPMSQDRYNGMVSASKAMVHLPFCLGAIAVFHSVPKDELGNVPLKLSPCVLAKIMGGTITMWDDAEIKALNPILSVPAGTKIQVGHRTVGSSSTGGITGYLEAKCPTSWTLGSGSTITWPTSDNFNAVQGSPGMLTHVTGTPYALGYLDAGHGHQRDLQEVSLQNEANTWLTSKDAMAATDSNGNNGISAAGKAAVDAGDIPTDAAADWSAVNLYRKNGTNTWPIVLVSYIYVKKDLSGMTVDKVAVLKAFVDMVLGEGQDMLKDFSFDKVPAAMNTWSTTWATMIKPAGFTEMTLLTSTSAWTGQGANVITSKRNSYTMWKLGELEVSLDAMTSRLEALETHLDGYGVVPLHGSGTTNTKNWFAKAMKLMETRARVPLFLTYRAVGSGTGQKEFVGDGASMFKSYSNFGAGDIPMSSSNFQALMAQTPPETMVHMPLALGAIGVFHSVPKEMLGGATEVKLDACLLAKIFSGAVTTWDDAQVLAQNPTLSVPAGTVIKVAHRTLGSSSTGGLSGYLNKKCPSSWTLGASSSISWPAQANFNNVEGSPGMQSFIMGNQYAIGYLDAGHGHDFEMSEVALTNFAGMTRTSKESIALGGVAEAGSQAASSNVFPVDASTDWSAVNLYDMPGDSTWPIVLVSYLYVKKDQSSTNPKTAAALQAFIDMVIRDGDSLAAEFGFTSPSASLRSLSLSAASTIVYPANMVAFTSESSTMAYTGMGVNVISSKRHSYDIYDSDVMQEALNKLREATHTHAAEQGSPQVQEEAPVDNLPVVLSAVALTISVLAGCMGCFALLAARKSGGMGSPSPTSSTSQLYGSRT
ncbi:unnamed protein product [Effrenium voratum]|nr:unnamed protein product [Effrenium voratum]|eukprot:CAMPEP_0181425204 /NCGR_PEP_ID=MMETSP1110-20121109/15036_1 /TAXON_ID=174948 /ORGANISM="Symbiodinium sp., Strain CCMP421" /LENGTH=902 /DNA_ID=CAMNT_0023548379 /DNA_START=66 /DNA_END=2774 /DNA_ORIENTATION=+